MTNIEIATITEAILTKQSWVRQGLQEFLDAWAKITKKPISGHNTLVLYQYPDDNDSTSRLTLVRGKAEIDGDTHNGYEWDNWEYSLDIEEAPIGRIRKIIETIAQKAPAYFRNIQSDITSLDKSARKIAEITKKIN